MSRKSKSIHLPHVIYCCCTLWSFNHVTPPPFVEKEALTAGAAARDQDDEEEEEEDLEKGYEVSGRSVLEGEMCGEVVGHVIGVATWQRCTYGAYL